jgi:outer membrane protein TolC
VLGYDPIDVPFIFDQSHIDVMEVPELAAKVETSRKLFQEETILQHAFLLQESEIMKEIFSQRELNRWTDVANHYRPDIRLSQTYVSIAEESVKKEQGQYLPTLSLMGGYGGGSTPFFFQPSTQFNNQSFQWAFGVSLNWLIFDSLGRENRIRKAKSGMSAVKFDAKKTLQAAHTDVRTQIYTMEKALAKYLTASANLKLAEQTLGQALSQLEIGYTTMYDYLISVDGLIRAKTSLDEGRYELLVSHYALLHSCGVTQGKANEE